MNHKILVVDDEMSIAHVIEQKFEAMGSEVLVTTVASAEQALEILDKENYNFDCLLVDIKLPKMSGVDFGKKVRKYGLNIPIVFIAGYTNDLMLQEAKKVKPLDIVYKPVEEDSLTYIISDAIEEYREYLVNAA